MKTTLHQTLNLLAAHVEGLREQGVTRLTVGAALPEIRKTRSVAPSAEPRVRGNETRPASESRPSASTSPPPARAAEHAPASKPAGPALVYLRTERSPECADAHDRADTALILVCEKNDLVGENGELLARMLHAIGYPLPTDTGKPLEAVADLHGMAARILCFGAAAHAAVSTLKMDLSLLRGKWQSTPGGRMIATHAPSYLEGNPAGKKAVWADLKNLLQDLGLDIPDWTKKQVKGS
ncbi:MAG: hypothetical protein JJU29_16355 [Verrucomicrobia bacterium]|nr:hypothetical protein [Verrucomicrobiota bacterium]MCH8513626.1 hypothetical protein [Kiritimatiellia bacterium]